MRSLQLEDDSNANTFMKDDASAMLCFIPSQLHIHTAHSELCVTDH